MNSVFICTNYCRNTLYILKIFKDILLNNNSINDAVNIIEKTYCNCPNKIDIIFTKYKLYEKECDNWKTYLNFIDYPIEYQNEILNKNWFQNLAFKASKLEGYYDKKKW